MITKRAEVRIFDVANKALLENRRDSDLELFQVVRNHAVHVGEEGSRLRDHCKNLVALQTKLQDENKYGKDRPERPAEQWRGQRCPLETWWTAW